SVKFQNKLLALFDTKNTALFIWNYDKDWSVDYTTDHIVNILGYTKDQFLRKDILYLDIIHKDDLALVNQEVDDAIKNNLNYFRHEPYRIITKDGDEKWILDQTMITKDDNKIINFIGFITDITDSKMKALQLAKSEKMASMGEMIGNIAHQWRQPIAIISMWANNIIADVDIDDIDNENLIKYSNNIQEQTKYLSQTIEDFRDFIKGDRVKTRFNLDDGVKSFLNLVEGSIKTHNIDIILDLQKDIVIEGYKNELNQCLINIFKNAKDILKVNIKDEKLIFISTSREGKDIVIKIKDNGGGIPEKILPKIFEPYFTTKHKSQGTGLGLNMTYNLIVKGMGGTIRVDNVTYEYNNKKFTGAEFTITLPIN
ncbi:MAG: PAS domain-containing sensor histidine kinase, partial [Campylobacterota bacterium]|nr:PAS domain-containing sensor histidine kinase [Campylobacterota bacterium]